MLYKPLLLIYFILLCSWSWIKLLCLCCLDLKAMLRKHLRWIYTGNRFFFHDTFHAFTSMLHIPIILNITSNFWHLNVDLWNLNLYKYFSVNYCFIYYFYFCTFTFKIPISRSSNFTCNSISRSFINSLVKPPYILIMQLSSPFHTITATNIDHPPYFTSDTLYLALILQPLLGPVFLLKWLRPSSRSTWMFKCGYSVPPTTPEPWRWRY